MHHASRIIYPRHARPLCDPIMTSTPFDVDYSMPDLGDDLDFDAWLDLPLDEGDQGVISKLIFFTN